MSYLQQSASPLPDMSSGIISLWFRDATKGPAPDPDEWPSGAWAADSDTMVPPDTTEIVKTLAPPAVFYWNAYGIPSAGVTAEVFFGPATIIMPAPPPLPQSEMHMMLCFGDDQQEYRYCPWELEYPDVPAAVTFITGIEVIYRVTDWPPPYKPYWRVLGGQPVGLDGKFVVANMRIGKPKPRKGLIPQSFIGLDKDGYVTICLQTSTRADFKGYDYQLDKIQPIWATQTIFSGVPPAPVDIPGYWDGWLFWYKDISNDVMGAGPESFLICGKPNGLSGIGTPRINDGTWHHLLFSFDISGAVDSKLSATPKGGGVVPPATTTQCKAWLAIDGKNITGDQLQHAIAVPNGFAGVDQLPGMGKNGIFAWGPDASFNRADLKLGPNDIVPQNVWVRGFWGNPREGLPRYQSAAGLAPGNPYIAEGDFNWLVYTGVEWILAGKPDSGKGSLDPPRPTNPDPPKDLDLPSYHCKGYVIPVNNCPIGIPASTTHLKHNTGLEMAELQIWANRTLNTGDPTMVRLFIDFPKDKNGNPDASKPKVPVKPKVAADALGKPDILLHGSNNWKTGANTGGSAVDAQGKPIGGASFTPIAKIEKFKPDPEIGK